MNETPGVMLRDALIESMVRGIPFAIEKLWPLFLLVAVAWIVRISIDRYFTKRKKRKPQS